MTKIKSLLADNCTYRPTHTTAPVIGKEKVAETIQGFLDRDMVFDVLDTVAFGPLVAQRPRRHGRDGRWPPNLLRRGRIVLCGKRPDRGVDRLFPAVRSRGAGPERGRGWVAPSSRLASATRCTENPKRTYAATAPIAARSTPDPTRLEKGSERAYVRVQEAVLCTGVEPQPIHI